MFYKKKQNIYLQIIIILSNKKNETQNKFNRKPT